jgi:hypothetical protein
MNIKCSCGGEYTADNASVIDHFRSELHLKWNEWDLMRPKQPDQLTKRQLAKQQYRKLRGVCDCGSVYLEKNKGQHMRTKKHQDWFKSQ